jgi:uncharacterized protein
VKDNSLPVAREHLFGRFHGDRGGYEEDRRSDAPGVGAGPGDEMKKNVSNVVTVGPDIGVANVTRFEPGGSTEAFKEIEWRNFESEDGRFFGGVWYGKPASTEVDDLPFDEFCYVKSGRVLLSDDTSASRAYVAGDGFFIPRGFTGTWQVIEDTELVYVILTPAGP